MPFRKSAILTRLWSGIKGWAARLRWRGWHLCERLFALREALGAAPSSRTPARKRTVHPQLEALENLVAPQDLWSLLPAAGLGMPLLTPTAALFDGFAAGARPQPQPIVVPISTGLSAPLISEAPPAWNLADLNPPAVVVGGGGGPQLAAAAPAFAAPDIPADPFPDLFAPVFADAAQRGAITGDAATHGGGDGGGGGGGAAGGGAGAAAVPESGYGGGAPAGASLPSDPYQYPSTINTPPARRGSAAPGAPLPPGSGGALASP